MATEVTFDPQGTPTGVIDAYYKAQDQRMSMMERSQSLKQQKLAQQLDEQTLAQWQVEAPIRDMEVQGKILEHGAALKERQRTAGLYAEFAQNTDQMQADFTDAMSTAMSEDGKPDWDSTYRNLQQVRAKWNKYSMLPQANGWFTNLDLQAKNTFDRAVIAQKSGDALNLLKERSNRPSDRTGALMQDEIDEFEQQNGMELGSSGMKVGQVKRISRGPSGLSIGEPAQQYQSPSQQGNVAFEKQYGEEMAKRVVETNKGVQLASQAADSMLVDIDTLEGLYESGLQTGAGNEYLNMFGATALRLGIGSSDRMATQEQAQQAFADMKLRAATVMLKGQGQVTEAERAMVEEAVAKARNSPAANMAIMKVLRKAAERAKEAAKYNNQLRRQAARGEIKAQEIQILMDEWYSQHSIGADALSSIIAREARNGGGDTGAGPTGTPTPTSSDETGEQLYNRLLSGGKK